MIDDDAELVDAPTHMDMMVINLDVVICWIVSLFNFIDGSVTIQL